LYSPLNEAFLNHLTRLLYFNHFCARQVYQNRIEKGITMHAILKASALGLVLALLATSAFANNADIRASDRAIEIEGGWSSLRYGETIGGDTFDTETGWMPSFDLGVTWLTPSSASVFSDLYFHLDGQVTLGSTSYNGGVQDGFGNVTPYQDTTDNQIYHVSGKVGRLFALGDSTAITPYVDLGFRAWNRHLPGAYGYVENYENAEAMGGMLLQVSPISRVVLSLSGEVGSTILPTMTALGSTFNMGSSTVWQLEGKAGYAITPRFELTADAQFGGFGFNESPWVGDAFEPNSYTHQLSLMGGLAYHLQ
jgi:hypothetical protein